MTTTIDRTVPQAARGLPLELCMLSVHGDPLVPTGAEEAGGQNVYVREVARALAERGHRVTVFTRARSPEAPAYEERHGFTVVRPSVGRSGFIPRTELFPLLPAFAREVHRWARREGRRFDAVHANYWLSGWVGMQLSAAWHVPLVHTHHSLGAVKYLAQGQRTREASTRLEVEDTLLRRAARVVATSPQEVENLARLYPSRARTAIVPCGVSAVFKPGDRQASRARLGLPAEGDIVAYVGRFDPAKGIDTLIDAITLLPEHQRPTVVFAGGFDPAARDQLEFERMRALVAAHGLADRAVFLGRMDHEKLAAVYAAADLAVVPSHYESFGMVAIEAMACGCPVVASEVGGLRYSVVHRETGLLVPVRSAAAFAGAISLLLDDQALREGMGAAGAALVQRLFTWERVSQRLEGVYREAAREETRLVAGA